MLLGKLHNAVTHLMSTVFVKCAYLCPQVCMVHTAKCLVILRSTEQIRVFGWVLSWCSTFPGLANFFCTAVCRVQCCPSCTSVGLSTFHAPGSSRPWMPHLIHAQLLPVHSLSTILCCVR